MSHAPTNGIADVRGPLRGNERTGHDHCQDLFATSDARS